MKINTVIIPILQVLWSHVGNVEGACNVDEHHPENNGYFIEGINGFGSIVDPISDSKRRITNSTWQAGISYPDGALKYCEGVYCSETCRNEGCPNIMYGHTCSNIRFCYESGSGSDVWMMPDEMAMAKCDFSNATQVCTETDGEDDDCCNFSVEEDADLKLYLFASKAGCDVGQKAAVEIADFAEVGDACFGMGLTTSRIRKCTCNYEDREMSTLSEPCHSQFVSGCNYHAPELGDDKSCCETGSCVGKHLDYNDPIGMAVEDDRKELCREDIPGRCLTSITGEDDCCTKTCKSCGTDINPFFEWAACDKGNATTSVGECGYGGHGGRYSKYECDFSKCEDGVWAVSGDLYKDWIKTVDGDNYSKTLTMLEAATELDLTLLESAIKRAGLEETLSGPGPFTLFAPTNEAFMKIGDLEDIPSAALKAVLLDHVVAGKFLSSDVMEMKEFTTVGGKTITFTLSEEGAKINNAPLSDTFDVEVSNGVIHVVSDIITFTIPSGACYDMSSHTCGCKADACSKEKCDAKGGAWTDQCPSHCDAEVCANGGIETKNMLEVAEAAGFFTKLLSAVKSTGLEDTLSGPGPFTLIAPTDEAFAMYKFDGTNDELKTLLTNHVISGKLVSEDITSGMEVTTLGGKVLTIVIGAESATINDASLVLELMDIQASNGIIHAVSSVLTFEVEEEKEEVKDKEKEEVKDKEKEEVKDKEKEEVKEEEKEDVAKEEEDNSAETSSSFTKYLNVSVLGLLLFACAL